MEFVRAQVFLPRDRLEVKRLWLDAMISVISERMQLKGEVTGVVLALKKYALCLAVRR
jgi:hypothetical protein